MTDNDRPANASAERPHFSYLAQSGPAGRRLYRRGFFAAAILLVVLLLPTIRRTYDSQSTLWNWVIGPAPGLIFGYFAWQIWRYCSSLDELARRLHLESMAVAYLISLTVAGILLGLSFADCCSRIPAVFYVSLWIVLAWALQELAFIVLRRRYE
jgi:hypothetical protein